MRQITQLLQQYWVILRDVLSLLIASVVAYRSVKTYEFNARTKSAEFLFNLHQSFFVDPTYKEVRSLIDKSEDLTEDEFRSLTEDKCDDFTDFLNFFELVAYLNKRDILDRDAVEALLGYYLDLLGRPKLRAYIAQKKNGFEQLDRLMNDRIRR